MPDFISQCEDIAMDIQALAADYLKLGRIDAKANVRSLLKTLVQMYLGINLLVGAILQAAVGLSALIAVLSKKDLENTDGLVLSCQLLLGASLLSGLCASLCLVPIFGKRPTASPEAHPLPSSES